MGSMNRPTDTILPGSRSSPNLLPSEEGEQEGALLKGGASYTYIQPCTSWFAVNQISRK